MFRIFTITAIGWLLLLVNFHSFALEVEKNAIDKVIKDFQSERFFTGTVLIAQGDTVLYTTATGKANRESDIANSIHTNFNIASVGKVFTSTLIFELIEANKLSLTSKVSELLPHIGFEAFGDITVAQLLTHTSGLGNYMMHPDYDERIRQVTELDDVMRLVKEVAVSQTRDSKFDYSNSAFIVLGKIIEQLHQRPYKEVLMETFHRLGMKNSYLHYPATFVAPQEATPYVPYSPTFAKNAVKWESPGFSDGGVQTNVYDLFQFSQQLINDKWLKRHTTSMMWTPQFEIGRSRYMAYGWMIERFGDKDVIGHNGGGKGFSASLRIVPNDKLTIIALSNSKSDTSGLMNALLEQLYLGKYKPPKMYKQHLVWDALHATGATQFVQHYEKVLMEYTGGVPLSARDFSELLMLLVSVEKIEAAEEIAHFAIRQHPEDPRLLMTIRQTRLLE